MNIVLLFQLINYFILYVCVVAKKI